MNDRIRKTSMDRRREIAITALRIIDEQGITSLSTATLAESLGLSSGAPFRHFDSWKDIYREMATVGLEIIADTFPDNSLPGIEQLFGLMENRINSLQSIPGLTWLLRSEQAYLTLPEDSVEALQDMRKRSRKYLLAAIKKSIAEGDIREDIEPQGALIIIMGTIHALSGLPGFRKQKKKKSPSKVLKTLKSLLTVQP